MAGLSFASEEYGRAVRVRVEGGREYVLSPGEFRACLAAARRQVARGGRDFVLSVPGKMRLRLSGCPRQELEGVLAVMGDVLDECRERATAYAALN